MGNNILQNNQNDFYELKRESQRKQKKGLPFIMSSVILWTLITILQATDLRLGLKNLFTFCCAALLLPLAALFAKVIRSDTFKKSVNPFDKLGILCTVNQVLYILIVMWAFDRKPEAMMMLFAMVFGAHLLPFGWLYDSKAYLIAAVLGSIGPLILAMTLGNFATGIFMTLLELVLTIMLFHEMKMLEKRE